MHWVSPARPEARRLRDAIHNKECPVFVKEPALQEVVICGERAASSAKMLAAYNPRALMALCAKIKLLTTLRNFKEAVAACKTIFLGNTSKIRTLNQKPRAAVQ